MSIYEDGDKQINEASPLPNNKKWRTEDSKVISDKIIALEGGKSDNTYLPVEVTASRAITTADTQKALWFKGIGSLLILTVNTGSLAIGKDLEVHVGDADGFDFVGGAGANVIGNITGSTTEGDTVGLRRLADASFGLIGEVYKVI